MNNDKLTEKEASVIADIIFTIGGVMCVKVMYSLLKLPLVSLFSGAYCFARLSENRDNIVSMLLN